MQYHLFVQNPEEVETVETLQKRLNAIHKACMQSQVHSNDLRKQRCDSTDSEQ